MEGLLERRAGGGLIRDGGLIEDDGNCSIGICTSKQTTRLNTVKQTLKIVSRKKLDG